jgi:uncharacterized protein DUF4440
MRSRTRFSILVGCALLAAASFATAAPGEEGEGEKRAGMPSMKGDAALEQRLEALERKTWDAFKAQDFKAFCEVVAPDALSADGNGFATRDQAEPMMKDYVVTGLLLQDFKLVRLDKDAAVLAYIAATVNATFKGEEIPTGPYYCSTVYVLRGGKWVATYHQETLSAHPNEKGGY